MKAKKAYTEVENPFEETGSSDETEIMLVDSTLESVDAALYGKMDAPPQRDRQIAEGILIDQITPDLAQPRKAIPASVRRAARQEGIPEWQAWHRIAEQLHGSKIDLPRLLKGEGDAPETEPLGIPLVDAFLDLVGLAATIYRDGQTNAITVVRIPGPQERYEIETGERRWQSHWILAEALGEAQFKKIKARIVDKANVWRQATENNSRRSLNAIGIARQIALLLMDLYRGKDGISILPYGQMVQDGECDRKFYAQVSNGNIYRIPKGLSERILQATGLKSRSQLARYRALLDIDDALWIKADEEDQKEGWIREEVEKSKPHTLPIGNISSQNANQAPQSTQQKVSPNPFGRPSSLPTTEGMGTQATGPKMMYMGATVEYVRIEETDNGPQAIIWTISPSGTRMMQRRVDPGELKDLPSANQRRMNGPADRSEPPVDHWIKIGLPVVHEMNGYRYEGTIKHAAWDSGMNDYMVKILTSAGKTEGPFESKNLQVDRTQVIAGENYKHRGGRLYHVTGHMPNGKVQAYEIYPDGKRKNNYTETLTASDLTPLKPAAPAPQTQPYTSPFDISKKIYQHRRTGILYRVKETHKDGSVSAIAVNEAGEDISKYTQSIDVTELKTYKPDVPQQPEEDLIAERQEQMLLALYHRQPVVKNAATRQALEEKLMIHVMDREAWDMGITKRGVDYLREHGLIEDEGDARIVPTESAATEPSPAPASNDLPAWIEEGITVETISGRRGVIVGWQMKDGIWEITVENQYGEKTYTTEEIRPASFETPFLPPAEPAPQYEPPEWARPGTVVRHKDTGKICDSVGTLRDDVNNCWRLLVDVRGETRADDVTDAFEPLTPEEIAALPTVARERHPALAPKNLTKVITEDQFGLAELETMAAQLRMLDEGKRIMRLKVITPNHLQTFIRDNGPEGAYAKVASLYEAGLETLEALEKRKQAMAANLEVVNAEVLEALRQMIAEQQ